MNEYAKIRSAGEIVRLGLQKEAGPVASLTTPLLAVHVATPYHKGKRQATRKKSEESRPYFDTETGRFI